MKMEPLDMQSRFNFMRRSARALAALLCVLAFAPSVQGATSGVTYQGRILKPDGTPLSGANVQFRLQLRTPNANDCLMYEEVQALDMRNTSGQFSLTMADGSGSRMDSTGLGLDRIFANRGSFTFSPATCTSGSTYTPSDGDGRNLIVLFKDETMATWEPIPAQKINFVPYAFESKQIAGFTADSLLRVVNGSGDPLTGLAPLSNAQYTALMDLVNGSSTAYTRAGQLNGVALPTMNSGEVLGWNGSVWVSQAATSGPNSITTGMIQNGAVDGTKLDPAISISTSGTVASAITTTRDFKIYAPSPSTFYVGMLANPALVTSYTLTWPLNAGSNGQVLTTNGSGGLTWTTPSSAGITDLTGDVTATGPGSVAATVASVGGSTAALVHTAELAANAATSANTPNTIVKRDGSGGFAAGAVTQGSSVFKDSGSNTVTVQAPTTVSSSYVLKWPTSAGGSGDVLTTDASGNLSWITPSGAPTGTAGGDLTGSYPNPTVATVGTSTAANIHTAEVLANAATDANTPSTIVKRDGSGNFSAGAISAGSLASTGAVTAATVTATGAVAQGSSVYKDSGSNTATIQAPSSVTSSYVLKLPTAVATSNQLLQSDSSGNLSWVSLPAALPPNGSAGGDLSGSYPNPTVATVGTSTAANIHSAELLANAAIAANTPNAIVKRDGSGNFSAGDITASNVKTDTLQLNNAGSVVNVVNPMGAAYTLTLPASTGTNGQVLATNGSGVTSWTTPLTGTTGFVQGGNTFGVNADLGTNDGFDLNFRTDGSTKMTVSSTGNVGIGTVSPARLLHVNGPMRVQPTALPGSPEAGDIAIDSSASNALKYYDGSGWKTLFTGVGLIHFTESIDATGANTLTPVVQLLATDTAGNVDVALTPKGNGGLAGQAADGTAVGGDKRGLNAVDWQLYRYGSDQIASGDYSAIIGGAGNKASGSYAVVLGGNSNAATGGTSVASGFNSQAKGDLSFAAGFSVTADSSNQITIGANNLPTGAESPNTWVATDPIFVVGNGTGGGASRSNAMMILKNGDVGIGTSSPSGKLDVKGSIVMSGATSGYAGFKPAGAAGSTVWTLPSADGTTGQVLKTDGSGNLGWVTPAGAGVTEVTSANADIGVANTTTTPVLTLNSGTGPNQVLKLNASSQIPAVDGSLITGLNAGNISSGTLPVSHGGTGATSFANYSVIASNGSGNQVAVPGSTSNTMLQWTVTGPSWSTATWPSSTTANQLLYSSANNVVGQLATANNGVLVTNGSGVPSIASSLPSAVQGNITSTGTITSGTWNGTAIGASYGGTGQTSYTTGDLLYASSSTALSKLSAGTNGYVLTSNGAGAAPSWQAASAGGLTNFTESVNTSAPNATVPVVSLTATNAASHVDIALSPKGQGALTAQVADSAATGGNKRGIYAVDWQTSRSAAVHVASGMYSVINGGQQNRASGSLSIVGGGNQNTASGSQSLVAGGASNTASGSSSTVLGGSQNTASGDYSIAGGQVTTAESYAQTTIGRYNMPKGSESSSSWVATDPLFVIGNGTGSGASRSTAMMVLKNGNVGIGTTSPGYKLDVNGAINATALKINGVDVSAGGGLPAADGSAAVPTISFTNDLDTGLYRESANTIGFTSGGVQKMNIAPTEINSYVNLNVLGGGIFADGAVSAAGFIASSGGDPTTPVFTFYSDTNTGLYSPAADTIGVSTSGQERMRIGSSGNVGIGTTSPSEKLEVAGKVKATELCIGTDCKSSWPSGGSGDFMKDGSVAMTGTLLMANTGFAFASETNLGITRFSAGTLGIMVGGSLVSMFDANGVDSTFSGGYYLKRNGVTAGAPTYSFKGDTDTGMYNAAANTLAFSTAGQQRITISSGGDVGVSTSAPNGKLDVKGSIVMSGSSSGYTGFQPAAAAGSTVWTLPSTDGTSGQVLKTDGSGNLGWVTPSGGGVTQVTSANTDIGVTNTTTTPVLTLNSGTGANQILKLNASSQIPAVNGSLITNLNAGNFSSGTLPVSRGGTGATSFANYSVIASNASGNQVAVAGSTSNTMLQWTVTGPAWSTATYPASTTANQLLYSSAANTVSGLTTANNGVLITSGTGIPSISSTLPTAVQGNITSTGTIASGTWSGTAIAANKGGTGQTAFTVGDLLYANSTSTLTRLAASTSGYVLTSNGAGTAPSWQAAGSSGIGGAGTASYVPKFITGTTVGNSAIYDNGGSVGIGTTAPVNALEVVGPNAAALGAGATANGGIRVKGTGTNYGLDLGSSGVNGGWLQYRDSTSYGSNLNIKINPNGGAVAVNGGGANPETFVSTTNANSGLLGISGVNDAVSSSYGMLALTSSYSSFNGGKTAGVLLFTSTGNGGSTANRDLASITALGEGSGGTNGYGGGVAIGTKTDNVTGVVERMRISATGNIGVGTSNPANYGSVSPNVEVYGSTGGYFTASSSGPKINMHANSVAGTAEIEVQTSHPLIFKTNALPRMSITSGGNVGIGTTAPSYLLDVNGDARVSTLTYNSDRRLKRDIASLERPLEKILALKGVSYHWRTEMYPEKNLSKRHQIGLIAQDVEKVYPELVSKDSTGFLSVNYPALVAPVIEAIKELVHRFENETKAQNVEIEALKSENKAMKDYLCHKDPDAPFCN